MSISNFPGENKNPFPEQSEMLNKLHAVINEFPNSSMASTIGVLEMLKFNLMIDTVFVEDDEG